MAAEHFQRYLALAPDGEHGAEAAAGIPRPEGSRLPQRVPSTDPDAAPVPAPTGSGGSPSPAPASSDDAPTEGPAS